MIKFEATDVVAKVILVTPRLFGTLEIMLEINLNRVTLDYVGEGDEHISDLSLQHWLMTWWTVRLKYDGKYEIGWWAN